jgi:hypothetical protein
MRHRIAANLRSADVPGLQAARPQPKRETAAGPYRGGDMYRCDDAAALVGGVVGIRSPTFVHLVNVIPPRGGLLRSFSLPDGSVSSGVYYFKSEAIAHEYLIVAHSARFAACVKTVAANGAKAVTREGSKVAEPMFNEPRLSTLSVSLPRVQAYGLRLATHPSRGGRGRSETYTDFLSFVKGDAVITLTAIGQTHPFPAARERRLLALLYSRAKAHKL